MQALNKEESLYVATICSSLMDDVEDAALRLLPFLAENKALLGEMSLSARLIANRAFTINGAIVARHYRRFGTTIKKSRSESDLPVKPTENYVTALDLATSIVNSVLRASEGVDVLFVDPEELEGGEAALEIAKFYKEGVSSQMAALMQLAMAVQFGLVLVNSGFDFDGIDAATKAPEEGLGRDDSKRYL